MQPVWKTAAVKGRSVVSSLSSHPPHPETLLVNSVTVCVLLPHIATEVSEQHMSVFAAQTPSPTLSVNLSALLPALTLTL